MNNFKFNKDSTDTYNFFEISNIIEAYPDALIVIDSDFKVVNYNQLCKTILIENNFVTDEIQIIDFIENYIIANLKNELLKHGFIISNIQNFFKTEFALNSHSKIVLNLGKKATFNSNIFYLISFQVFSDSKNTYNNSQLVSYIELLADNKIDLFEKCCTFDEICDVLCNQLLNVLNKAAIWIVKKREIAENNEIEIVYSQAIPSEFGFLSYKSCLMFFFEKCSTKENDTENLSGELYNVFSLKETFNSNDCNEKTFPIDSEFNGIENLYCQKWLNYNNFVYWFFLGTEKSIDEKQTVFINNWNKIAANQLKLLLTNNELRKTKNILSQFIDYNPYSIAMADGNGFFVRANKAFTKLWGEVPPKEHNIFYDPLLKAKGIIDKIDLLNKGQIDKLEIPPFWYNPRHINPSYPDINLCVEGTMFTIRNEDTNKIEYYVVMQHDVTEKSLIYQKLIESEEKYRTIFEQIQDVYFEVDHENIIREISPSVEFYTHYKREEILNTSFLQYLVEPERMTNFFENLFKYGRVRDSEIKIYDKNKEILICASNCILVQKATEGKYMIIGSLTNISDLIKIRNQLIETQYKYSEIINNIGQGICILDENETFIFANPAANQIFEVAENGLIGRNISEFVDDEQLAFIKQQTEERKKGLKNKYSLKINIGGKIKFIQLTASPQYDENNNFYGSLGIFQDITESQFLQQELQKSEEKYRELFENANDIIYTMDLNGNFTSINLIAEKILGYSIDELKQIHLKRIVDATDYHMSQNSIMEAVRKREQHSKHEIEASTKDGKKVVLDINSFLKFKDGKPYEIFGIARDITARKLAEQKVIDALAEKEILLREVHHRVKNNLQVIMSLINFQITDDLEPNVKEKLIELRERIRTMSLIHEDLYISEELSKVEFGIYLEKLIGNVTNIFDAQRKGINIVLETKVIIMDIEKAIPCGMIVNEMLSNALKYAFPEDWLATKSKNFVPTIKISFKISKGVYVLTFEDNGIGLPEKIDKKKKTTLGLWLINILTKDQLNGKITINRRNGTKYLVKFSKNSEK